MSFRSRIERSNFYDISSNYGKKRIEILFYYFLRARETKVFLYYDFKKFIIKQNLSMPFKIYFLKERGRRMNIVVIQFFFIFILCFRFETIQMISD